MIPLIYNSSLGVIRSQSQSSRGLVVKTLVGKSRDRGFESHREQKVNFSNFIYFQKLK